MNDGQNIIEIVGDPAGKLTNGFHFLRLAQLVLQPFLSGDIAKQSEQ